MSVIPFQQYLVTVSLHHFEAKNIYIFINLCTLSLYSNLYLAPSCWVAEAFLNI